MNRYDPPPTEPAQQVVPEEYRDTVGLMALAVQPYYDTRNGVLARAKANRRYLETLKKLRGSIDKHTLRKLDGLARATAKELVRLEAVARAASAEPQDPLSPNL